MKPNQTKSKLQLKKQAVSNLSNSEMNAVRAGNAEAEALTTSKGSCTGFTCCDPTRTCTIIEITIITITLL